MNETQSCSNCVYLVHLPTGNVCNGLKEPTENPSQNNDCTSWEQSYPTKVIIISTRHHIDDFLVPRPSPEQLMLEKWYQAGITRSIPLSDRTVYQEYRYEPDDHINEIGSLGE